MNLLPADQASPNRQKRTPPEESDDIHVPVPSIEHKPYRIAQPTSPRPSDSPMSNPAMVLPNGTSRQASPAISTISTLTSVGATPPPVGIDGTSETRDGPPPAKKRRLTFAEKEVRRAEQAEKERSKAEQKAKKEEEKQAKDDEQRQKNEMKEEKRRQRDLEKQQKDEEKRLKEQEKDEEKRRKEEEKLKKEKAQPRIMSFFAKPQQPITPHPAKPTLDSFSARSTPPLSNTRSSIPPEGNYYERTFLPFSLPSYATCAPVNRFSWDDEALAHLHNTFEAIPRDSGFTSHPTVTLKDSIHSLPWTKCARVTKHSAKDAMSCLAGSFEDPADLTDSMSTSEALRTLREIPIKYIYFQEDVRPPYIGTYTKDTTATDGSRVARNPFSKVRIDTDYEYDSEGEWEEPEEGEDLESEGDSDVDSVGSDEDLEGFLDDEDPMGDQLRKTFLPGDMEPLCSGLRWANASGSCPQDDKFKLNTMKLEVLDNSHKLPIDPYSTGYWNVATGDNNSTNLTELLPRPKVVKAPLRLLSGEELENFKKVIAGSPHNKIGLLAILKKEWFPKIPAAVLKDTLETVGARVGPNAAEKRWVVVNPP